MITTTVREDGGISYATTEPAAISPRLTPGVRVGDGWLSAWVTGRTDGRYTYAYAIDTPGGTILEGGDLSAGYGAPADVDEALRALLAFLQASADEYRGSARMGTAWDRVSDPIMPARVAEWAYMNSDELDGLAWDLSEDNEE